ncbi:unnamed protein product [Gordionus sp. m RMFG-2023]
MLDSLKEGENEKVGCVVKSSKFFLGQEIRIFLMFKEKFKWTMGKVGEIIGNVKYMVKDDNGIVYCRHQDRLGPRE